MALFGGADAVVGDGPVLALAVRGDGVGVPAALHAGRWNWAVGGGGWVAWKRSVWLIIQVGDSNHVTIPQISLGDQWLGVLMISMSCFGSLRLREGGVVCLAQDG